MSRHGLRPRFCTWSTSTLSESRAVCESPSYHWRLERGKAPPCREQVPHTGGIPLPSGGSQSSVRAILDDAIHLHLTCSEMKSYFSGAFMDCHGFPSDFRSPCPPPRGCDESPFLSRPEGSLFPMQSFEAMCAFYALVSRFFELSRRAAMLFLRLARKLERVKVPHLVR
jgi:hypothetical protein